jgi:hypothetical protein
MEGVRVRSGGATRFSEERAHAKEKLIVFQWVAGQEPC